MRTASTKSKNNSVRTKKVRMMTICIHLMFVPAFFFLSHIVFYSEPGEKIIGEDDDDDDDDDDNNKDDTA